MKMYNKVLLAAATVFAALPAFAEEAVQAANGAAAQVAAHVANNGATAQALGSTVGLVALGIGIMMGLAVLGGTLGQSKAAATALDGIARNPAAAGKFIGPLILSLALIETLILFAFVIAFLMQGAVTKALAVISM